MPKPSPPPVEPEEALELARQVVAADRFPMLATEDGYQPRLRPISPLRTVGFTVYFASLRSYHKTAELEANPRVELCYMDEGHNQVRLTGLCELITDDATRRSIWDESPLLRQYLGSIDNPEFLLYKVTPTRVRYMREWALQYTEVPFEQADQDTAK